jgi:transcription elongation factor Elf1
MNKEKKPGFFEVLKSTPQTLEAANKKTKYFFILVGAIALVFSVLAALLHIFFGIIMLVGCAGIFAFLYLKENQKNKRNFCSNCGTRIDYENGVAWKVTEYEDKNYTPNANSNNKQIIKKRIATVEFTCTCTECGDTKSFTQKYDAIVWYDNNTKKENNIAAMAENYFKI